MTTCDIAFIGHYTKDTIVSASGTRIVDGGAFNYGAHVAASMGLKVAAVTRLAQEDQYVADRLAQIGVEVLVHYSPQSTCLRLEYPSANVDERVIYVTSAAGAFTPAQVEAVQARAFVIGASIRGEVGLDVIQALRGKDALLAADVQGFVRVERGGELVNAAWPEKAQMLACLDVLKTDAVEAHMLTGEHDMRIAARMLADMGPREIVLTHRDGVLVYAEGQYHEAGFFPRELVGRSGRGDTCVASFVARRLTAPPAEATIWAAAATSLKMEAEGPFKGEVDEISDLVQARYSGGG